MHRDGRTSSAGSGGSRTKEIGRTPAAGAGQTQGAAAEATACDQTVPPPKVTIDVPLYFDVDIPVTYNDSSTDLSVQTENDEESPSPDFKEIKGRRMKRKRKRGVVSSLMKKHAAH